MKKLRYSILSTIVIVLVITIQITLSSYFSLLALSNQMTLVGLVFFIIGLFLAILKSGSFDFFIYSMQSIRQLLRKRTDKISPLSSSDRFSIKINASHWYFLQIAFFLFIISGILILIVG